MSEPTKVKLPDGGWLMAQWHAGPPTAPAIVLSNSVMTDRRIWDQQVSELSRLFSVLRYDQRGHGQSSVSTDPLSFDDYGSDVIALLDAFEVQSCVFIGLSMGVPTGLAAMRIAPQRFKAFVAVDGVAKSAAGREAFWSERRDIARKGGLEQLARATAQRWLPGESEGADLMIQLSEIIEATPVEGFAAATHALQGYDYSSEVIKLDVPFLALAGEEDGAMPDAMRKQFNDVPGAQFETIGRAGHVPNFQRPEAFNQSVLNFLGSLSELNPRSEIQRTIDIKNTEMDELS